MSHPATFVVPTKGGTKSLDLWIQLDSVSDGVLELIALPADDRRFSVMFKEAGQEWSAVALNSRYILLPLVANSLLVQCGISVTVTDGSFADFRDWTILVNLKQSGEIVDSAEIDCRVICCDQGPVIRQRLLPAGRAVQTLLPGFRFGSYRWRPADQVNAHTVVPTNWSVDPGSIGLEKFSAGIGYAADLELVGLEKPSSSHSVLPRIRRGYYFTGAHGYFCPSGNGALEILPVSDGGLELTLAARPARQLPVFVGSFRQDDHGYYDVDQAYRYVGSGDGFDESDTGLQFRLDRQHAKLTLNRPLAAKPIFAGFATDADELVLELPVYPVLHLSQVYIESPQYPCRIVGGLDPETNSIRLGLVNVQPDGSSRSVYPGGHAGHKIFIEYTPAVAVLYESEGSDGTRLLAETDLNPAFAGISSGYLYLMHRRQKAKQLELYADKPQILIPPTFASIVGLVGFGPVYFENDYALLMAQVTGNTSQELIPNTRLRVVPGADFQGLINYLDPLTQTVEVISGGDGKAYFVYTPARTYGFYLDPAASVNAAAVTLPEPAALTQLWNADEGWLVTTYYVRNDHPFLGKVGANIAFGEVAWQNWNQPGSILYRTNGMRVVWRDDYLRAVRPSNARDSAGNPALVDGALNPSFDGNAVQLVYDTPLPADSNVGAYFISFIGRIQLQVQDVDSGQLSNTILLQLEAPPEIKDAPDVAGYLYLNEGKQNAIKQGRLNANRLGGAPIPQFAFTAPRY